MSAPLRSLAVRAAAAAAVLLIVTGCATPPRGPGPPAPAAAVPPAPAVPSLPAQYMPAQWSALPGWSEDRVAEIWPAFRVGCVALLASAATRDLWQAPCSDANAVATTNPHAVREFFESHFSPYQVIAADGRDAGTITGYYEPLLSGSRARSTRHRVPLYAVPDDLLTIDLTQLYPELKDKRLRGRVEGKRVIPYWPRTDIENGKAPVKGKELVYVDDPVEAFFLQIQGSGRVRLADGGMMRVGYADQNGHPFRSIGRLLVERGELPLERASMQGIKDWGRRNPDKLAPLLDENPSYVFFREVPAARPGSLEAEIDGPIGTLGVPLLRERTLAVDPRSIPLGTPVFLATTYPLSTQPLQRLMLAQDTGGAIRGAVRADFFWGFGPDAGRQAGRMKQDGRMWLLWPVNGGRPGG
ncbi:MAG: MltA domain-containing protein [Betaproteobacteria bacterium]|nr:MltA domain-containing protein [Betaproteobacteria bacterium]